MCDYSANPGGREAAMVEAHPGVWCDPCIAPFVKALNEADQPTVASCCGHGAQPGKIALADGRELFILPDFESARRFEAAHSEMETLRRFKPKPAFQSPAGEVERLREPSDDLIRDFAHRLEDGSGSDLTFDEAAQWAMDLLTWLADELSARPPSDSQGDQHCPNAHRYVEGAKEPCPSCGLTPDKGTCPDCNPAPTQPGKTQPRTPNKDPVRTEKPAPTQVEGDECERCKGSGQIEDAVGGDLIGMEMIACPACNGTGKRQPEGGDEEDWPEVWLVRLPGRELRGLPILDKAEAESWERTDGPVVRRYLPASSQDPSGLEEANRVAANWKRRAESAHRQREAERDRASKAEAERDRALEYAEANRDDALANLDALETHRRRAERYENALEELATWAEDRSVRLSEAVKVATKEKLIPEELPAKLHATFAAEVCEKAAKLKEGGNDEAA